MVPVRDDDPGVQGTAIWRDTSVANVERTGRLVRDQHARLTIGRAGDVDALFLALDSVGFVEGDDIGTGTADVFLFVQPSSSEVEKDR